MVWPLSAFQDPMNMSRDEDVREIRQLSMPSPASGGQGGEVQSLSILSGQNVQMYYTSYNMRLVKAAACDLP
jgi:hypothetical protein